MSLPIISFRKQYQYPAFRKKSRLPINIHYDGVHYNSCQHGGKKTPKYFLWKIGYKEMSSVPFWKTSDPLLVMRALSNSPALWTQLKNQNTAYYLPLQ